MRVPLGLENLISNQQHEKVQLIKNKKQNIKP